jgi:hypothetical protein
MLRITAQKRPLCDGMRRRDVLRVGATGLLGVGLGLPRLLEAATRAKARARAKSLILFVLEGGPAHQDLWDMKPAAPVGVRSEFRPIETTVPLAGGRLITSPSADDFPPFGSVLAKLRPTGRNLPDLVHMPDWMSNNKLESARLRKYQQN